MGRDEILAFLEAIDVELVEHAGEGERLDLYLIGRSALIFRYGLNLATKDVNIVHFHGSKLELKAVELFGKGTRNAARLGFYLEPVPPGLPPIPGGYCHRSEEIPGRWRVLRPRQPELHDLAATKLKRFHAGDREDLQILCDSGELGADRLREMLESAFTWAEEEDPERDAAARNLAQGDRVPRREGPDALTLPRLKSWDSQFNDHSHLSMVLHDLPERSAILGWPPFRLPDGRDLASPSRDGPDSDPKSGPLGYREPVARWSFMVLRREGLPPGNRRPRVSKERSPKGRLSVDQVSSVASSPNAFIPPPKGVGFRLDFCNRGSHVSVVV